MVIRKRILCFLVVVDARLAEIRVRDLLFALLGARFLSIFLLAVFAVFSFLICHDHIDPGGIVQS